VGYRDTIGVLYMVSYTPLLIPRWRDFGIEGSGETIAGRINALLFVWHAEAFQIEHAVPGLFPSFSFKCLRSSTNFRELEDGTY
jgi:hypothetical protein